MSVLPSNFPTPAEVEARWEAHCAELRARGEPIPEPRPVPDEFPNMDMIQGGIWDSTEDLQESLQQKGGISFMTADAVTWEIQKIEARIMHLLTPELRDLYNQRDLLMVEYRRRYTAERGHLPDPGRP